MLVHTLRNTVQRHARPITYLLGSAFVASWTLLRFFTQHTIFDLVGQQVLTQQWLSNSMGNATIGVTSYIPKMLLLYAPLHVLPGSPRLKLLLLTIAVNVATFVLIGILLEKILRQFGVKIGSQFYAGLLWLAGAAGSVFWIQFTNSRNLEVVGGIFLLYQSICYLSRPSWRRLAGIAAFSSALFFADSLQIYMTAVPVVLYGLVLAWRNRPKMWNVAWLVASFIAGFAVSKLLLVVAGQLFSLHFLQASSSTELSAEFLKQGLIGSAKAFEHLYSGAADAGKLRELCSFAFLFTALGALVYAIKHRLIRTKLLLLVGCIVGMNELVYLLGGQAQHASTERYLIMTVPAVLLAIGASGKVWNRFRNFGWIVVSGLVAVNFLALGRALATSNKHFVQDKHLASVGRYLEQNPGTLAYASMDTALPMAYLSGSDIKAPLPLSCKGQKLFQTNLFYTETAHKKHESAAKTDSLFVILDSDNTITNNPSVCSTQTVVAQLGNPTELKTTDDGSSVLVYPRNVDAKLVY